MSHIHSTSIIDPKAQIGNEVTIGPFCVVGKDVQIGNNVELKSHVVIEGITSIGDDNVIYPFASIGHAPQDLKYKKEPSKVIIGNKNTIREYVTIQPGTSGGGMITSLGDNCLLMVGVHIAHDCKVGNNVILANYASLGGHVEVGDHSIIGGLAAILQNVKVGAHSILGGLSGLAQDLIPFGLANATRAHLAGLNLVGMNRRGFDKNKSLEANKAIEEIFSIPQNSSITFSKRIENAYTKYQDNEIIMQILDFLKLHSDRAFCMYSR